MKYQIQVIFFFRKKTKIVFFFINPKKFSGVSVGGGGGVIEGVVYFQNLAILPWRFLRYITSKKELCAGDDEWMTGQWAQLSDAREYMFYTSYRSTMTTQYVDLQQENLLGCTLNAEHRISFRAKVADSKKKGETCIKRKHNPSRAVRTATASHLQFHQFPVKK